MPNRAIALLFCFLCACSAAPALDGGQLPDGGGSVNEDAGAVDPLDGGADAGVTRDGGAPDAGRAPDAGVRDGGSSLDGGVKITVTAATGQSFGAGPTVKFWFTGRNRSQTQTIDMVRDPEIGTFLPNPAWLPTQPWTYWYDARSQRYFSPTVINTSTTYYNFYSHIVDMGNASSETEGYLVSWRFVIPDGYFFPGTDAQFWSGADTRIGSSMKMAWVTTDGDDTAHGDLVLLSQIGGGNLGSNGNGTEVMSEPNGNTLYFSSLSRLSRTDHSNRTLAYLQRSPSLVSGDVTPIEWSVVSSVAHAYTKGNRRIVTNVPRLNHRFIAFPGWMDTTRDNRGTTATSQVLYGDIYVAQGPTAQARVEIGDAATYEACKWLFLAPPTSWSNTVVEANFFPDEVSRSRYWFITTANGTRYSGPLP